MPTSAQTRYSAANRLEPMYLLGGKAPDEQSVSLAASTTYAKGTVLGELTATPGTYKPYASVNTDGSQVPKCILKYACVTDGSGNITLTGTAEFGQTSKSAPAYFDGAFKTAELTGLDANAVTVLGGHLVSGTVSSGVLVF